MNALKKLQPHKMTVPEFLAWADQQPGHWQLRDGEPELMAPAADRHGRIQAELGALISNVLRPMGNRCCVVIAPGVIPRLRSDRNMLVPDIAVTCSPSSDARAVPDPIVLIEILSPSNEMQTRANVWAYSTIPTVTEIVLLTSLQVSAEVMRRLPDGSWPEMPEFIGRDGRLVIERIGFECPLLDVYATTDLVE
jgi:Uma2 family endonuclease